MKNITLTLAVSSLFLTSFEMDISQSCPQHQKLVKGKCVCKKGYIRHADKCQRCPDYAYYDCKHDTCKCEPGYDWIQKQFVCKPIKKQMSKFSDQHQQLSYHSFQIPSFKIESSKPSIPLKPDYQISSYERDYPSKPSFPSKPSYKSESSTEETKYSSETFQKSKTTEKYQTQTSKQKSSSSDKYSSTKDSSSSSTYKKTEYQPKIQVKPAPKPEYKTQVKPKPAPKPQPKPEYKTQVKPTPKPEPPKKPAYNTPGSCPSNSFYNPPAYRCDCNYGWMWDEWGINCIPRCGVNEIFVANSCRCLDGYVKHFGEKCVTCPPGSHLNPPAYRCDCDNYGWVWNQNGTKCSPPKW